MDYAYWKEYDNKNYSFEDALKILQENKNMQMRVHQNDSYKEIRIDSNNLPENIDDISIPLWAIRDPYWHLYVPDYEMEEKVEVLRDYLEEVYQVDNRFYDVDKMDIGEIFNQFELHVFDDNIRMKILLWLLDNDMIQKR